MTKLSIEIKTKKFLADKKTLAKARVFFIAFFKTIIIPVYNV